ERNTKEDDKQDTPLFDDQPQVGKTFSFEDKPIPVSRPRTNHATTAFSVYPTNTRHSQISMPGDIRGIEYRNTSVPHAEPNILRRAGSTIPHRLDSGTPTSPKSSHHSRQSTSKWFKRGRHRNVDRKQEKQSGDHQRKYF
ncbi:hypothetical protein GGI22_004352, partial [Coemansia erecta]